MYRPALVLTCVEHFFDCYFTFCIDTIHPVGKELAVHTSLMIQYIVVIYCEKKYLGILKRRNICEFSEGKIFVIFVYNRKHISKNVYKLL